MKVLVIGRSGQVAQSLMAAMRPSDTELVALGRPMLDLTDPASTAEALEAVAPDAVVNAAAYTAVDKAEDDEAAAYVLNVDGAAGVAKLCAQMDIPLIHLSTDYVFDGTKPSPYVETDPVAPLGVYGRTKLAGEQAVVDAAVKCIVLRTAWVISPYGHNFAKTMLRLAGNRDHLNVVDDQFGTPTYAPHLAIAIIRLLEHVADTPAADVPWGIYHAAGRGETTWCGLARTIFEASEVRGGPSASVGAIATAEYPTRAKRPSNSRLNSQKLEKNFAVRLPDWQDGVIECVSALIEEINSDTDH